jgi:hypothetical protein
LRHDAIIDLKFDGKDAGKAVQFNREPIAIIAFGAACQASCFRTFARNESRNESAQKIIHLENVFDVRKSDTLYFASRVGFRDLGLYFRHPEREEADDQRVVIAYGKLLDELKARVVENKLNSGGRAKFKDDAEAKTYTQHMLQQIQQQRNDVLQTIEEKAQAKAKAEADGKRTIAKVPFFAWCCGAPQDAEVEMPAEKASPVALQPEDNHLALYQLLYLALLQVNQDEVHPHKDGVDGRHLRRINTEHCGRREAKLPHHTELEVSILEDFATIFLISRVTQQLTTLHVLDWNQAADVGYFIRVGDCIATLHDLWQTETWSVGEIAEFKEVISSLERWFTACIMCYDSVFENDVEALRAAVLCFEEVWDCRKAFRESELGRNFTPEEALEHDQAFYKTIEFGVRSGAAKAYKEIVLSANTLYRRASAVGVDPTTVFNSLITRDSSSLEDLNRQAQLVSSLNRQRQSNTVDEAVAPVLNDNFDTLGVVQSPKQLLHVLKAIQIEIKDTQQYHVAFDMVAGFSPTSIAADTLFFLCWIDCKLLLTALQPKILRLMEEKQSGHVVALYQEMTNLYHLVSQTVSTLPQTKLQDVFLPFVDHFVKLQSAQSGKEYLQRIIKAEDWKSLGENTRFSHSVIDVMAFCHTLMVTVSTKLPYLPQHIEDVSDTINSVVRGYVDTLRAKLLKHLEALGKSPGMWGFLKVNDRAFANEIPPEFIVCLNNLHVCYMRFDSLLQDIDFYQLSKIPVLGAKKRNLDRTFTATADEKVQIDLRFEDMYGLNATFGYIQGIEREILHQLATDMSQFCVNQIDEFVSVQVEPDAPIPTIGEVHNETMQMFDFLVGHFDLLTDRLPQDQDKHLTPEVIPMFLEAIYTELLHRIESVIVVDSYKNVLTHGQVRRVRVLMALLKNFFTDFGLPQRLYNNVTKSAVHVRVSCICKIYESSTESLIERHRNVQQKEKDNTQSLKTKQDREDFRTAKKPYLSSSHLFAIIKHRHKQLDDELAASFVKEQGGLFDKLF